MKWQNLFFLFFFIPFAQFGNLSGQDYNEALASSIYPDSRIANHTLIEEWNKQIIPDFPTKDSKFVKDAWLRILYITPSIMLNESLYVPEKSKVVTGYGYGFEIPENYKSKGYPDTMNGDCKTEYSLSKNYADFGVYFRGKRVGDQKEQFVGINKNSTLESRLGIDVSVREKHYRWHTYCCAPNCEKTCHRCVYSSQNIVSDKVLLSDKKDVKYQKSEPEIDFQVVNNYFDTTKIKFNITSTAGYTIKFTNSSYSRFFYSFRPEFAKTPNEFAVLRAERFSSGSSQNLIASNNTLFVKDTSNCKIITSDFFSQTTHECDLTLKQELLPKQEPYKPSTSLWPAYALVILLLINLFFYKTLKHCWKKASMFIITLLLMPSSVLADCGLTNLADCIPQKMYDYFISMINKPMQPLLNFMKELMYTPVNISTFHGIWALMIYLVSMFYTILFIWCGYNFMFSGMNFYKRQQAKEWLRNVVVMIILVQASFYIYGIFLDISGVMTGAVLSMADPHFFMITMDNIVNIGLEFLLLPFYLMSIYLTTLFLVIRYLIVAVGVVFFPIGIFLYFVPPLRGWGKFILNILFAFMFLVFIDALVILACSMLLDIPLFANFKIVLMICSYMIMNFMMIMAVKMAIGRSTFDSGAESVTNAVKYIAMAAG